MEITQTSSELTLHDHFDHFLARWGYRRGDHRVEPGLYALGKPGKESPVFATANYTLSFDALRSALKGIDGYVLVLDTYGINVWCAAGKGTFGTDELVKRIQAADLANVVSHKKIVLPQLGAPGVDSFAVTKRTGFRVEYGPVKASDLHAYLGAGKATPEHRLVRFPLWDRIVLAPVELMSIVLPAIVVTVIAFLLLGWLAALAVVTVALAGTVLFPVLLPYLPTKDYSTRGLFLGILAALPFAAYQYLTHTPATWAVYASMLTYLFIMPPVIGYLALNFTGCTPYPSRTGVRKEIYTYVPVMAGMLVIGAVILAALTALSFLKVI